MTRPSGSRTGEPMSSLTYCIGGGLPFLANERASPDVETPHRAALRQCDERATRRVLPRVGTHGNVGCGVGYSEVLKTCDGAACASTQCTERGRGQPGLGASRHDSRSRHPPLV